MWHLVCVCLFLCEIQKCSEISCPMESNHLSAPTNQSNRFFFGIVIENNKFDSENVISCNEKDWWKITCYITIFLVYVYIFSIRIKRNPTCWVFIYKVHPDCRTHAENIFGTSVWFWAVRGNVFVVRVF